MANSNATVNSGLVKLLMFLSIARLAKAFYSNRSQAKVNRLVDSDETQTELSTIHNSLKAQHDGLIVAKENENERLNKAQQQQFVSLNRNTVFPEGAGGPGQRRQLFMDISSNRERRVKELDEMKDNKPSCNNLLPIHRPSDFPSSYCLAMLLVVSLGSDRFVIKGSAAAAGLLALNSVALGIIVFATSYNTEFCTTRPHKTFYCDKDLECFFVITPTPGYVHRNTQNGKFFYTYSVEEGASPPVEVKVSRNGKGQSNYQAVNVATDVSIPKTFSKYDAFNTLKTSAQERYR